MASDSISVEEAAACNAVTGLIARTLIALEDATPGDQGVDYKHLYYFLFNGISDVIEELNEKNRSGILASVHAEVVQALSELHCAAEDLFSEQVEKGNTVIPIVKSKP